VTGARSHTGRATLFILFSACAFGSIATIITLAMRDGTRLIDLLAWRFLLGSTLLVLVSGGVRAVRLPARRVLALLVLAGGGQAAITLLSFSALRYIPVATLTFLFYSYPAWVAIIAAVRGTERLTARRGGALLLSLLGLALMIGMPGSGGLNPFGVLLALSSALLYAFYIPLLDYLGTGLAPAVTGAYAAGGAAIILTATALLEGGLAVNFTPAVWISILVLAVVCTVLAFMSFLRGLAVIGPVRTAIVSTVEPFWAALLATVVLRQPLGARTIVGGLLIALAVIVLQLVPNATAPAPVA
jgi:drug/metabolite transporter (DMT)-like permease